jgi:hypothetical protein
MKEHKAIQKNESKQRKVTLTKFTKLFNNMENMMNSMGKRIGRAKHMADDASVERVGQLIKKMGKRLESVDMYVEQEIIPTNPRGTYKRVNLDHDADRRVTFGVDLHISNLDEDTNTETLVDLFQQVVPVWRVKWLTSRDGSQYVLMKVGNPEDAQIAIRELDGVTLHGANLNVSLATNKRYR